MERTWQKQATNLIKVELAKKGISYEELQKKLAEIGVDETANGINAKINRGTFSFMFFLQTMTALGVKTFRIDDQ